MSWMTNPEAHLINHRVSDAVFFELTRWSTPRQLPNKAEHHCCTAPITNGGVPLFIGNRLNIGVAPSVTCIWKRQRCNESMKRQGIPKKKTIDVSTIAKSAHSCDVWGCGAGHRSNLAFVRYCLNSSKPSCLVFTVRQCLYNGISIVIVYKQMRHGSQAWCLLLKPTNTRGVICQWYLFVASTLAGSLIVW